MAIIHTPDSEYSKEMVKWESARTDYGPGLRPYTFQEYPKRLSRAGRTPAGMPIIVEELTVESEVQEANLLSRGFRFGHDQALAYLHAEDQAAAVHAAERAYHDRRMSPQAQAEAAALDAVTTRHLGEMPAHPLPPRKSHKKKAQPPKEQTDAAQ